MIRFTLIAAVGACLAIASLAFVEVAQAEESFVAGVSVDPISQKVSPMLEFALPERYAGRDVRFHVCWVNVKRKTVCVARTRTLLGSDTSSVITNIRLSPTFLRRWTTFRWYFEGRQVTKDTFRVKR
jgi:hypothetical protein